MLLVLLISLVTKLGGQELLENNCEASWHEVVEIPQNVHKATSGEQPVQDAIIMLPRIEYNVTISINLHTKQVTKLNFPLYQVDYKGYQSHETRNKMRIDTYLSELRINAIS